MRRIYPAPLAPIPPTKRDRSERGNLLIWKETSPQAREDCNKQTNIPRFQQLPSCIQQALEKVNERARAFSQSLFGGGLRIASSLRLASRTPEGHCYICRTAAP